MKKVIIILIIGLVLIGIATAISLSYVDYDWKTWKKVGELKEISSKEICKAELNSISINKICPTKEKIIDLKDSNLVIDILENDDKKEVLHIYSLR